MKYNFDRVIDRKGTDSVKMDLLPQGAPDDSLSLWVADMDFACADPIIEALQKRIDHKIFGYTYYDNELCKEAVKGWFLRRFGWTIDKDTIFYCPGVVPAFSILINILTNEGDGVIIQRPVYYPFTNRIEGNHRRVVNNSLIYENGQYRMDYQDLEEKLKDPANKGILFCSPHNPTGRVWTEDELRQMVELCKKYNKWIISDEIHGDLTRTGVAHHPLLKLSPEYKDQIIACTAPSKSFNLAGMHISNIIIENPEYQKKWKDFVDNQISIGSCNPLGLTAMIAAYNEGEEWLDQAREYIDENIRYVKDYVEKHFPKAIVVDTQGTYLMWIDFNAYCNDHKKLEYWMQKKARVALDEGYIFGEEGKGFERINVASPRSILVECMARMTKTFDELAK